MKEKEEIEKTFRQYLHAIFTRDYDGLYALLYEYDAQEFRDKVVDMARQMDDFGETDEFLRDLDIPSLKALEALSLHDFMNQVFKMTLREVKPEYLDRVLSETTITRIEEDLFYTIVHYEYPVLLFDQWETHKGSCQMIKSHNRWQLFFKSGIAAGLSHFQEEIDTYYQRKERDKPANLAHAGDLTPFTLTGYKDFATGRVVFEPRFKNAGEFESGLAPVQVMNKYGYLDMQGDLAIKPRFLEARPFAESLAAVRLRPGKSAKALWGFIDTKGKLAIKPAYTAVGAFSEGLCAVQQEGKWGYIDSKGKTIIPFQYDAAEPFEDGQAEVSIDNEQAEDTFFTINKEGNIIEA